MPKPSKYTRYGYTKSPTTTGGRLHIKEVIEMSGKPESEEHWKDRMRGWGITEDQLDAFVEVRSLEAFLDYCRDQKIESADIGAERVYQG